MTNDGIDDAKSAESSERWQRIQAILKQYTNQMAADDAAEFLRELQQQQSDLERKNEALENSKQQLDQQLKQQTAVAEIGRLALSTIELPELLNETVHVLRDVMQVDFCTLLSHERDSQLTFVAGDGWANLFVSAEVLAHARYTVHKQQSTLVDDFNADQYIQITGNMQRLSGACVIVRHPSNPWGVLAVHTHHLRRFDQDDINLLESVAHLLSVAIERRRLENMMIQAQKLESLGVFAAGIAHDFNNLLTQIVLQSSLAASRLDENHPARDRLLKIERATNYVTQLTNQLLAYVGKVQFQIETVVINRLIRDCLPLVRATIPYQIQVTTDLIDKLPQINVDTGNVQQVLTSLMSNSAEAYDGRSGNIHITTRLISGAQIDSADYQSGKIDPAQTYLCLTVSDHGRGMDARTLTRVFDPFYTTKHTGYGLGLPAVQGIMRQHHGAITIRSKPELGTTCSLYFPVTADQLSRQKIHAASGESSDVKTILYIDDNQVLREGICDYLKGKGYRTHQAEDGMQGIAVFEQHQHEIDLILLDMTMPGLSIDKTFHRLRQLDPTIRILVLSGYGAAEVWKQLHGEDYMYLQKPFSLQQLQEMVESTTMYRVETSTNGTSLK